MKKLFIGLIVFVVLLYGVYKITAWYQNRPHKPDLYYDVYTTQDTTPVGKVAVFLVGLSTAENHEPAWWHNILQHVRHAIIPWPGRFFAGLDMGIALFDPERFYEYTEFEPTDLVDYHGSRFDIDGIPYIEKYRRGEVEWKDPSNRIYLDSGYFLYKSRKGGIPSLAGKTMNRARLWYYGKGFKNHKVPAEYQRNKVLDLAFEKLQDKYGPLPHHRADSMDPWEMHQELYELLDGGADTIVLTSQMVVYSHYEEFNNSFKHSFEIIRQWEKERGKGKKIKIIMAPPLGHFPPMRQGFIQLLKNRLDILPKGASVKVAVSIHGMPWDHFPNEAWLKVSPAYRDPLLADVKKLVKQYEFSKTEVVECQDHFADPIWDPEEHYLSTNRAYLEGKRDGFDFVVQQPMEFFTENTDTMFSHAKHNYHHFPGYDIYETIDYPDWDVPYTREFDLEGTHTIYNGVLTGPRYRGYVADSLAQAIDSILSKSETLQAKTAERFAQKDVAADAQADSQELL
jgi:hypothetical protein